MPPNEVVLVRHGETEWAKLGRHTGRTDIPLTDEGRAQAELAGRRLVGREFALVLTSPLSRAAETCRLAGFADQCETTDDLLEWDYGDYEGRRTVEIRVDRPGWTLWADGVPGGETASQVGGRADKVIERALAAPGDVLLFAHGHLLRVLGARWLDLEPTAGRLFALSPATLSVLGFERETRVFQRWNDICDSVAGALPAVGAVA
jgi:probable phosphoglycerate mutase